MSSTDIFQLYLNRRFCGYSCGIVISPRNKGLKALCVHITQAGYDEVLNYCREATEQHEYVGKYVTSRIALSSMKFYCQIPFDISTDPCFVVDFRSSREVTTQLSQFIMSGNSYDWGRSKQKQKQKQSSKQ